MSHDMAMGIGIGLLTGGWLVGVIWFVDTLVGKSLAARRARRAFDRSLDPNIYPGA